MRPFGPIWNWIVKNTSALKGQKVRTHCFILTIRHPQSASRPLSTSVTHHRKACSIVQMSKRYVQANGSFARIHKPKNSLKYRFSIIWVGTFIAHCYKHRHTATAAAAASSHTMPCQVILCVQRERTLLFSVYSSAHLRIHTAYQYIHKI